MDAFLHAFGSVGFAECVDGELEEGIEKIAIYCDRNGKPTHAARQLEDGAWSSKCGHAWDIRHDDLDGVGGHTPHAYGDVNVYMSRGIAGS